ncbi:MAG: class I tRNA ligase family protein, partial [Promicromonosporaceae bacterium]|nr:class I tRNA ligase family protein [Promicromonosporaceae bacterium]
MPGGVNSAPNGEPTIEDQVIGKLTGAELAGVTYQPPFSYYENQPNAFQVVTADYVTTTDGTGLVHTAPAFGEDDKLTGDAHDVEAVMPVGPDGKFQHPVTDYLGMQVFDANSAILDNLKNRTFLDSGQAATKGIPETEVAVGSVTPGTVLVKREQYAHSYPHCYRCKQPLIYMGVSSWFVAVTKIKDRMLELGEQISWTPDYIKDGIFGKWIANARDWSITRNRFWGTPVPVWKSDNPEYPRVDAYGSLSELEKDFGVQVTDLHRPYIDELTRPNPDDPTGKSTMRRVEDIMDVWVDSGSMPYAQVHYPFDNQDWFEHHYPGDFIVEYIGQTRGWFYVLHVLATAIFDRPAFRTSVSHGIVLGSDGTKMSKSLRNYPDVAEVFDRDGADAMRWYLMSSPILRGGNLIVTDEGIRDTVRQVLLPLWSTYYFFTLYANSSKSLGGGTGYIAKPIDIDTVTSPLDKYILAKTSDLVTAVTAQLDAYDIPGACESIRVFLDILTNWYVRTQRDRFWIEDQTAFDTLYSVLETLCRVTAPLAPLTVEEIWRGLTGQRSVHLTDWPGGRIGIGGEGSDSAAAPDTTAWANPSLVSAMDEVRAVVSTALSLRKSHQMRVRQPLARLMLAVSDPAALAPYRKLLQTELNVKAVELMPDDDAASARFGIAERLAVLARIAGPRLGKRVQEVIKATKAGKWQHGEGGGVIVETESGAVPLQPEEYTLETVVAGATQPSPGATQPPSGAQSPDHAAPTTGPTHVASVLPKGGFVVLDLGMTAELKAEGYARDAIRE